MDAYARVICHKGIIQTKNFLFLAFLVVFNGSGVPLESSTAPAVTLVPPRPVEIAT